MSLLQMSAAGAAMILATTVIRALAMNRVPKKTFLALWGAALARLLIPFSLPSALSVYSLLKRKAPSIRTDAPAAALFAAPSEPVTAVASPQRGAASSGGISPWSIVWIAGMALCAAFFAAAYWRCYREFRTSLPVENDASRRWLRAHPLRRGVSIRQSDRVSSPLTFGVLRPVILMPKGTDWEDEAALKYVLEHEFVHIQRFDALTKLLLIATVCAHWFNPMVWVMYALANRDLELSCDENVVRRFGSGTRVSYARVLIRMEEEKSGLAPLCNHFSKNAIEERITAIMKIRKTTILSLVAAAALVTGTVTAFATSAKNEENRSIAMEINAPEAGGMETIETGEPIEPSAEYLAAGIIGQGNLWFYQEEPVAAIYDDNGGIYMNDGAANGVYLHVRRDDRGGIAQAAIVTRKQFRELADRQMNLNPPEELLEEDSLMSYVNPDDGKTYYSFDGGKTFEPMTDAELEARCPSQSVEWWTYDEYRAWLEEEKVALQNALGERGWNNTDGDFVWTQEKIDETIALYENILKDIQSGTLYSKTVDGQEDWMVVCNPADQAMGTSEDAKELCIRLDNGEERTFGPYETDAELLTEVKPFCEAQVRLGNLTQREADEILSRYAG